MGTKVSKVGKFLTLMEWIVYRKRHNEVNTGITTQQAGASTAAKKHGLSTRHARGPGLKSWLGTCLQPQADVHSGGWQAKVPVLGLLALTWDAQMEFQALSFDSV